MELKMPYPCLHRAAPRPASGPRLTLNLHSSSSFAAGFAADHGHHQQQDQHQQDQHQQDQHRSPSPRRRRRGMSPGGARLSPSPGAISAAAPKAISSPSPRAISANPRLISPRAGLEDPHSMEHSGSNKQMMMKKKQKPLSSSSPRPPKHSLASPNRGLAAGYEPESSPNRGLAAGYEPESSPNRGSAAGYEPESSPNRGSAAGYEPESSPDRGLAADYEPESSPDRGSAAGYEPESSPDRGLAADYEPESSPDRGDAGDCGSPDWARGDRPAESLDHCDFSAAVDTSLARQALERLLIIDADDGGASAASDSDGVSSSPERADDRSLQDIMYDTVSSRLLLQRSYCDRRGVGRNEWLYALLPADLRPSLGRHVAMVIDGDESPRIDAPFDPAESAQVRKLDLGRMSAASAMHGYFLAQVHRRFELEHRLGSSSVCSLDSYVKEHGDALKPLRALQCSQTVDVIERYVETLFGKASSVEAQTAASQSQIQSQIQIQSPIQSQNLIDDIVDIRLDDLESLLLHALAFGALLWDAEARLIPHGSFVPRHHRN